MFDAPASMVPDDPGPGLFAGVFDASPIGIVLEDLNGQPLFANPAFCSMMGLSLNEVIGKHCVDFSPREDAERDWALFAQLREGAIDHYQLDKRYFRRDGSIFWGRVSISLLNHRPSPMVLAIVEDITERKRSEELVLWHLGFEQLMSNLSRTLISLPEDEIDAHIEHALARIGAFLEMDRVTLYELVRPSLDLTVKRVWSLPGVSTASLYPGRSMPVWMERTLRGELSLVSQLDDLPVDLTGEREFFRRHGIMSAASIPLNVAGEITGTMTFATTRRTVTWTEDLVRQLRAVGDLFTNTLTRKRASQELRDAQSIFSRRLIQAQEEERAAVGRELHDDINQRVALAALNLEAVKRDHTMPAGVRQEVAGVIQQLTELADDIQTLSHRLHSSKLEQLGLKAAAAGFCREVSSKHRIEIEFQADQMPDSVRSEIALCLYRVLQEAVQNATKHSGAARVHVTLTADTGELQLTVRDFGKGFDVNQARQEHGIGLANMRERLGLVRGRLSIDSQPGRGTTLLARVPLG